MLIGRCQPFPLGRLLSIRYRGLPYGTGAIHYHIRAVQSANGSKESRFRYRREYVRHSLSPCRTFPYRTFSISSPLYENRLDIYIYIHRKRRQLVHSSIFFEPPYSYNNENDLLHPRRRPGPLFGVVLCVIKKD